MPEITTPDQSLDDWEALQKYCDEHSDDIVEEVIYRGLIETSRLELKRRLGTTMVITHRECGL